MTHSIIMPDLGQTVAEGKILRWLKQPGDHVNRGEALLEVETDKVTMEVESYRSGYLRAILASEGEMASAMSPVAVLTDAIDEPVEGGGDGMAAGPGSISAAQASAVGHGSATAPAGTMQRKSGIHAGRVAATPAAKLRARERGVDL